VPSIPYLGFTFRRSSLSSLSHLQYYTSYHIERFHSVHIGYEPGAYESSYSHRVTRCFHLTSLSLELLRGSCLHLHPRSCSPTAPPRNHVAPYYILHSNFLSLSVSVLTDINAFQTRKIDLLSASPDKNSLLIPLVAAA
jgi:hypothetical protein